MNRKPYTFSYHNTDFEEKDDLLEIIYRRNEIDDDKKASKWYGYGDVVVEGCLVAFKLLVDYATLTFSAMSYREIGLILSAEELEKEVEIIYNALPKFSRW